MNDHHSSEHEGAEQATVMVVDDNEPGRYVTRRILQRAGYRVLEAATGQQAIDAATQQPQLVVLDVKLPDFSGFEVCRRLRADPATSHIPVLHLSASFQDDGSVITGLEGGADGYLTQPVEPSVLLAYVRALLRMSQTLRYQQRSEARFRSLFESMSDGLLLVDPEARRFSMANQALCELLGYSSDELLQLWLPDLAPPGSPPPSPNSTELVLERKASLLPDMPVLRKDGCIIHVDIGNTLLTIDDRSMVLSSFRDVTKRRALENRLAQSDRLASVGLLASGVAHELNNPLAHVLLDLEATQVELSQAVAGAQTLSAPLLQELLARVSSSLEGAQRIRGIVSDLQTFSRIEHPEPAPVPLDAMLRSVAAMVTPELRYRARLELELELDPTTAVIGNQGRLSQAFLNLLVNAAHNIDEGHRESNRILVRASHQDGTCRVEIRDTGRGLEPDRLATLFDPFKAIHQPGEQPGLGLAIAHRIVDEHGGHILVESTLGEGSCFTVVLPCAKLASPPPTPEPAAAEPTRPIRLLVIDDEPHLQRAMKRLLERSGYRVVTASNGLEAQMILMEDRAFDVILCDLMMPELNGMELHAWLVEQDGALAECVIFLTGGTFTDQADRYLASIPNTVLSKPIPMVELLAAIKARLDGTSLD